MCKLPHSCGSSDALQVFQDDDGSITGFCFACHKFVHDPLGDSTVPEPTKVKRSAEEIREDMREIASLGTPPDIESRRLRGASLEKFGIKVGYDERDGKTPRIVFFPMTKNGEIVRYKVRLLDEKRMWSLGVDNDVDMFGWSQAIGSGAKKLIITEGEFDAVAMSRILETHTTETYKEFLPAVVSLSNGASGAAKDITKALPQLKKFFTEVILCFDQDEPGRKAVEDVIKILPEVKVAELPCKDANEALMKGMGKAVWRAVTFSADKPKNTRLVWLDDIWEDSKKPAEFGVSWPWTKITELTRGIRKGETIYIGAAQKMGKSEVVNTLAAHLIKEHNWKVMLAKPEEANVKSAKLLAGKIAHKKFHDPNQPFDESAYEEAGKKLLGHKVCMVNLYQHMGWKSLKEDITAAAADGVDAVFIDPITNLTNGVNSADANTLLQEIAQELAAMAKDLNLVIFIFCHLRNPESGLSHDRGGEVLTSQFAGSRAMGRSCNYMFGIEGNKDPKLSPTERNTRTLVLLDDREFGEVGRCNLYWDSTTTEFNEMRD